MLESALGPSKACTNKVCGCRPLLLENEVLATQSKSVKSVLELRSSSFCKFIMARPAIPPRRRCTPRLGTVCALAITHTEHSASSRAGMELSRALHCQPCRVLKGHTPFASAGLPRALWPSRRCEVFRLAGLARAGECLPWLTHPAAPHSDAWPHNCVLERRCLLLLLLAAAQPAAQAAAGASTPDYETSEELNVYI